MTIKKRMDTEIEQLEIMLRGDDSWLREAINVLQYGMLDRKASDKLFVTAKKMKAKILKTEARIAKLKAKK